MNQDCKTCRWGPSQRHCRRPHCGYEVISNGELIRRLKDKELASILVEFPIIKNEEFLENWLKKDADDKLLGRFYVE